jgi:DNA-directed RNA polymerase specialized sigma24 family protein
MRPVIVFAKDPGCELEQLRAALQGRRRQAARAVMVLLSLHGLPPAQIAGLLDCHPATVRRWISRLTAKDWPGWPTVPGPGAPG